MPASRSKQDVIASLLLVIGVTMTSVTAFHKEPVNAVREAKMRLVEELKNHRAVMQKISPSNDKNVVPIEFLYWLFEVLTINEVEQSVTSVGYAQVLWRDEDLAWNESDYEGVRMIRPPFDVWFPDFLVTNVANENYKAINSGSSLLLHSDGLLELYAPLFLKTTCELDPTYFPFDSQLCEIIFLPLFDDVAFNITILEIDNLPDPFSISGEWTILTRELEVDFYRGELPFVRCKMKLLRSCTFYLCNVVAPIVVTSLMKCLVFWIPPGSGEKISFLVTVFVSNSVFLNSVAEALPRSLASIPRLTLYIIFVIVQSLFVMVATIFVMRRYQQEQANDAREAEKAIWKQIDELTISQMTVDDEPATEGISSLPPAYDKVENWKNQNILQILFNKLALRASKIWSVKKAKGSLESRRNCCRGCWPRAATWDIIFFFFFNAIEVGFLYFLFKI